MALTAKQKEINERDRQNGYANKKAVAKEKAQTKSKKTITMSDASKVSAASSGFGGMLGKAADALKKNRVKDVD